MTVEFQPDFNWPKITIFVSYLIFIETTTFQFGSQLNNPRQFNIIIPFYWMLKPFKVTTIPVWPFLEHVWYKNQRHTSGNSSVICAFTWYSWLSLIFHSHCLLFMKWAPWWYQIRKWVCSFRGRGQGSHAAGSVGLVFWVGFR